MLDELEDDISPAIQIGKPAQRAESRVDDVIRRRQRRDRVIDVRDDEASVEMAGIAGSVPAIDQ